MDEPVSEEFPLVLFGNYTILPPENNSETETLSISISERNMMTGEEKQVYKTSAVLEDFLKNPGPTCTVFSRIFSPIKPTSLP